jgi:hypothetical protein
MKPLTPAGLTPLADADLKVFLSMINQNCASKLAELDREAFVAKCLLPDDAVAKGIADRRQRLLDLPSTIKPGTRAELAAQWPADFPPLSWAFVARDDAALVLGLPPDF